MPQIIGIWGFSSDRIRLFCPVKLKGVFDGYLIWQALHQFNKKVWNQAHVYRTELDQFFKLCSCRKYPCPVMGSCNAPPQKGWEFLVEGGGESGFCVTKIFKYMNQASLEFILNT